MSSTTRRNLQGHVLVTAALIGSLAMVLAAGLNALGLIARTDALIAAGLRTASQAPGLTDFSKTLPDWGLWGGTAVVAYGLTFAMLSVPGSWRRMVLWVSLLLLVAGWAPVLVLASHAPNISAPFVAGLWSGLCSWIYARSRQLPCERALAAAPPTVTS
jgi:hypothetical protein